LHAFVEVALRPLGSVELGEGVRHCEYCAIGDVLRTELTVGREVRAAHLICRPRWYATVGQMHGTGEDGGAGSGILGALAARSRGSTSRRMAQVCSHASRSE
jgi:hypothetical protein